MKISGGDQSCRYLAALGTRTADFSPFGRLLKEHGVELPTGCSLKRMVDAGWLRPMLRVRLPQGAFNAWRDYPYLSMNGADECAESERWALEFYLRALNGPGLPQQNDWWHHFLDIPADPVTQAARANAIDPKDPANLPPIFHHAHTDREICPWLDFFAYWQAYSVAEILEANKFRVILTGDSAEGVENVLRVARKTAEVLIEAIRKKWEVRENTFDWLSRIRTVFAASISPERSWDELDTALSQVAATLGLTADRIKSDIRDTLLVMWQEWRPEHSACAREYPALRELLRQDIQYAVTALERLTGKSTDFLDPCWYEERSGHRWAPLIAALPFEEEVARHRFPDRAMTYLKEFAAALPASALPDADGLRTLVARNWSDNRPLRRFVLAFDRLHRELAGQQLMATEAIIHAAERIEQFLLTVLHTERILSHVYRVRTKQTKWDVRDLAKESLNYLLSGLDLHKRGICAATLASVDRLMQERANLRELDQKKGLPFVVPDEVKSGSDVADQLAVAFVNFVIARNYAAHHDALDADLIYPTDDNPKKHPGHTALSSVLLVVVTTLQAVRH